MTQDAGQTIGNLGRIAQRRAYRQEDVNGKLVTLRTWHQTLGNQRHEQPSCDDTGQADGHRRTLTTETNLYEPVIPLLRPVKDRRMLSRLLGLLLPKSFPDKLILHDRHHEDGHQERHREYDGDGIGEPLQEVVQYLVGSEEQGEEGEADDQRSGDDAFHELAGRRHGCLPATGSCVKLV